MAFSVSTSWLLPMNDRLHVRVGLDISGEDYQANIARLGAYLGTLPEYSLVDVVVKHAPPTTHLSMLYCVVCYGPGREYGSLLQIPNALSFYAEIYGDGAESFVDGVGFSIPARDVRHAVVRMVPDISEIKTQDDLDYCFDEMDAKYDFMWETAEDLAETMPDGSLMDVVVPAGSPDSSSGALVDYPLRQVVYRGSLHALSDDVPPWPHIPWQGGGIAQ